MATYPTSGAIDSGVVAAPLSSKRTFVIEKTFDLTTLVSTVLANADIVNLLTIPAGTQILSACQKIVTAGTKDATTTTFTTQLRHGTTNLGAALDATTANGVAAGGAATYNMPLHVGTSDVLLNVVVVCSGGNATVTKNPVIRVTLICADFA